MTRLDLAMMAGLVLLAALCVIAGLIYHRVHTLLHWIRATHNRAMIVERKAADRWLEDQARPFLAFLLKIEASALPPFGPWVARADFLTLIVQHILSARPRLVVEFGSGASTLVILRALELNGSGTLVSFDHDSLYAGITEQRARLLGLRPDIRVVELGPGDRYAGQWYRTGELPGEIDCLIVDGPPRTLHPETREGAAGLFDRLGPEGIVFLDDADRPGETAIVERWARAHPEIAFRHVATVKGTAIGERRAAPREK